MALLIFRVAQIKHLKEFEATSSIGDLFPTLLGLDSL